MTGIKNQDTQGDDYKITKLKVPVLFPFLFPVLFPL